MALKIVGELSEKRILFLQGPMGPFFQKLDRLCRNMEAQTFRICFNGGDYFYSNKRNLFSFSEHPEKWDAYISNFLKMHLIDTIFLYGDCRYYHRKAIAIARSMRINVYVFEEGYIRPNYITLEKGGVNAFSSLERDRKAYQAIAPERDTRQNSDCVKYGFQKWALHSVIYYICMAIAKFKHPYYRHHRNSSVPRETIWGLRNIIRKGIFYFQEKKYGRLIQGPLSRKYFFVPLQTLGDAQITVHSPFNDMKDYIKTVIASFSKHADKNTSLIFKHHPIDRGRKNYTSYIRKLAKQFSVDQRVISVNDLHLPTCLKNALGTVTINSTVGLSSLYHGIPTIVLGDAFYDIKGLTCNGLCLDRFWTQYTAPEKQLFSKVQSYLIRHTQLSGSFYTGFPEQWNNFDKC
ncbi:MAG: capsular biosynthesis protein [Desulfobacteraceae bacterium]|nr:capsular biosynthesis protein [Desulfobacteraceae bacterium]